MRADLGHDQDGSRRRLSSPVRLQPCQLPPDRRWRGPGCLPWRGQGCQRLPRTTCLAAPGRQQQGTQLHAEHHTEIANKQSQPCAASTAVPLRPSPGEPRVVGEPQRRAQPSAGSDISALTDTSAESSFPAAPATGAEGPESSCGPPLGVTAAKAVEGLALGCFPSVKEARVHQGWAATLWGCSSLLAHPVTNP